MTEDYFIKKNSEFKASIGDDPVESAPLVEWGDLLCKWAEAVYKQSNDTARVKTLFEEADEKFQSAIAIDETLTSAYEKLSDLYFRRVTIEDPEGGEKLKFEASLFAMGAGSNLVLTGDLKRASELFSVSFEAIRDTNQVAVIPFTFKLGIDYLLDQGGERYIFAAKRLTPTCKTSGHEEMSIIVNAILDGKAAKPAKHTLAARASYELAKRIVDLRSSKEGL